MARPAALAGFTIIELLIAISVLSILMLLAIPLYSQFIANTQIRAAADAIVEGARTAQTEAVKRNKAIEFHFDSAMGWSIVDPDPETADGSALAQMNVLQSSPKVRLTAAGSRAVATFNGLGRVLAVNADGSAPLQTIEIATTMGNVDASETRPMRVLIGSAYGVKACDPALAVTDPAGCPIP